jgi:sialate O-acetylesterase
MSKEALDVCLASNANDIRHSTHWYAMVKPLLESSIFGVVFYQGMGNLFHNLDYYNCTFPALINDWRNKWFIESDGATDPQFPFGFVLNANMAIENVSIGAVPKMRWQQSSRYGYAPNLVMKNVFMASALDLVDNYYDPLHPRCKEDVGIRLSLGAFKMAYKMPVEFSPPRVLTVQYIGKQIKIIFIPVESNATVDTLKFEIKGNRGFEVCCDALVCHPDRINSWQPLITPSLSLNETVVTFDKPSTCNRPMFIRYLWRQKPCEFKMCPLYMNQLPINPFIAPIE